MSYRIRFDGAGSTDVFAHSPGGALELAEMFAQKGKANVIICNLDEQWLSLSEFRCRIASEVDARPNSSLAAGCDAG